MTIVKLSDPKSSASVRKKSQSEGGVRAVVHWKAGTSLDGGDENAGTCIRRLAIAATLGRDGGDLCGLSGLLTANLKLGRARQSFRAPANRHCSAFVEF